MSPPSRASSPPAPQQEAEAHRPVPLRCHYALRFERQLAHAGVARHAVLAKQKAVDPAGHVEKECW